MRLKPILLQLIQAGRGDGLFRASRPWGFPGGGGTEVAAAPSLPGSCGQ